MNIDDIKNMKAKQAHEMTNTELFEELKSRGFYLFPNKIDNIEALQCMVVGIKEPSINIYFYRNKEAIDAIKRDDDGNIIYETIDYGNMLVHKQK